MTHAAITLHASAFEPARAAIAAHDGMRRELVHAMHLQAEVERASNANLRAVLAGDGVAESQHQLDEAVQALAEYQGGRWLALFFFLTSPLEDLTHDDHHH